MMWADLLPKSVISILQEGDSITTKDAIRCIAVISLVTAFVFQVPHTYKECFGMHQPRRGQWCPGLILCIPMLFLRTICSPYFWLQNLMKGKREFHSYDCDPAHVHHFYKASSDPSISSKANDVCRRNFSRQESNASANLKSLSST